jgi:catechol-2,3-dioxygenase
VTERVGSHRLVEVSGAVVARPLREEAAVASPKLAHLILNTSNYEASKQWYLEVLEATIGFETEAKNACFLRIDDNHHRIGMFKVAETDDSVAMTPPGSSEGINARVNHFSFEYPTLEELLENYTRLAESAIVPKVCLNHGPTTSMYYEDPNKNAVELYYDTKYTEEQIAEFYAGGDRYVLGATPYEPAEMLKEFHNGKTVAELTAWTPPTD